MTKDKVKEIIEDIFEGKWEDNVLVVKNCKKENVDVNTTLLLLQEQKYITVVDGKTLTPEAGEISGILIYTNLN